MSLYTKYRPRDWDSVIGQDAISTILRTSLIQDRVGHAYILTGSRGTGKTTTARILAKGVNCKDLQNGNPCHVCTHCVAFDEGNMLDCIEIDGASNNGVENVRDLIEKARFEPNQGKYKIYIIDEVHMLSTGAFNALLKTLEEPPDHVKFILATTEIDKVPETIRSRSLRFDFKKISETDIVKRLEYVCQQEGIKAEKEALDIIARAARGALRDALTLTEQNTVHQEISTEYVRSTLSLIEDSLIDGIIDTIVEYDKEKMITILDTLRNRHAEVRGLFDQIMYGLRDRMLDGFASKNTGSFALYSTIFGVFESAYGRIRSIPDGWLLIEITLMRAVVGGEMKDTDKKVGKEENSRMGVRGEDTVQNFRQKISSGDENSSMMSGANIGASLSTPDAFWRLSDEEGVDKILCKADTFGNKSIENGVGKIETHKPEQILSEDEKTTGTKSRIGEQIPTGGQKEKEKETTQQILSEEHKIPEKQKNIEDPEIHSGGQDKKTKTLSPSFSYLSLLEAVRQSKPALVTDLKTARFEVTDTTLTLIFASAWHYGRINTPASKNTLSEILEGLYKTGWNIICKLDATVGASIVDDVF